MRNKYFVFDTNTLISAYLKENSLPNKALYLAIENGILVNSKETLVEFKEVFNRKKFDKYVLEDKKKQIFEFLESISVTFMSSLRINDCRDSKDNKFLELAVEAKATCLITGDDDLLVLHPFRTIAILNASDFLKKYQTKTN